MNNENKKENEIFETADKLTKEYHPLNKEGISFDISNLSDVVLGDLFHGVIWEMNKRKAEKEKVDVGFWDSEGNYKQDIQLVAKIELKENIQPEELEKVESNLKQAENMPPIRVVDLGNRNFTLEYWQREAECQKNWANEYKKEKEIAEEKLEKIISYIDRLENCGSCRYNIASADCKRVACCEDRNLADIWEIINEVENGK